ncbi:hypothetical protein [Cytobacillus praedii]|uniref:hypothetical protein n=1 Tax=Cytobacillus praedii TaxID=1742358 RepID=UPI002E1F1B3E|nr:hypothetical protein [Cytobacillus praedii]
MAFLTEGDLPTYYPAAVKMSEDDKKKYLSRANAYAFGIVGGIPTYSVQLPEAQIKAAVALAFEILAEGQDAQTNSVNGNITEAAPTGFYVRKASDPLAVVDKMLLPYKSAFESQNTASAENGVIFL